MRFAKILAPEIFKGTRGNPELIEMVRDACSLFRQTEYGLGVFLPDIPRREDELLFRAITADISTGNFFKLGLAHKTEKASTYHICKDFLIALHRIPDRDLNISYLPENFTAYVSLPDSVIFDKDGDAVTGFYVKLCRADKDSGMDPRLYGKRVISFSYQFGLSGLSAFNSMGHFIHELVENETVSEMCSRYKMTDSIFNPIDGLGSNMPSGGDIRGQVNMLKTFFNIILYINSSDPDLMKLTPSYGKSNSQKKKVEVRGHLNECTIPVIAINWDYQLDESNYVEGSVNVRTHPRWQPCGTGFSQVKLIWVKEHQRTVKLKIGDSYE